MQIRENHLCDLICRTCDCCCIPGTWYVVYTSRSYLVLGRRALWCLPDTYRKHTTAVCEYSSSTHTGHGDRKTSQEHMPEASTAPTQRPCRKTPIIFIDRTHVLTSALLHLLLMALSLKRRRFHRNLQVRRQLLLPPQDGSHWLPFVLPPTRGPASLPGALHSIRCHRRAHASCH